MVIYLESSDIITWKGQINAILDSWGHWIKLNACNKENCSWNIHLKSLSPFLPCHLSKIVQIRIFVLISHFCEDMQSYSLPSIN